MSIKVDIPGYGELVLQQLITDYTGTLSYRGALVPGIFGQLRLLSDRLEIHVLSADTRGTVADQLDGLALQVHILQGRDQDTQKRDFAKQFDLRHVVAFGNGLNDRLLLQTVKQSGGLSVAVDNGEGCAIETLSNASIFVVGASNALDLLIDVDFVKATLRF